MFNSKKIALLEERIERLENRISKLVIDTNIVIPKFTNTIGLSGGLSGYGMYHSIPLKDTINTILQYLDLRLEYKAGTSEGVIVKPAEHFTGHITAGTVNVSSDVTNITSTKKTKKSK